MTAPLDNQTVSDYQRDGVTVLRGVFKDWVDTLRAGVEADMRNPDPKARSYDDPDGGGRFFVDYCNWSRIPEYRDFIFKSPAAQIAAQLMDSRKVQLFHEHVLVKEAQTGIPTPWHHDAPYYCVSSEKTVSLWVPLDEVPRERTLEFVAGSHAWGKSFRPQKFDGQALNANDGLEPVPDIDGEKESYDIVGWALSPGDALAFDYRTLHGAPANTSASARRRAFSLRLVGDGATFVRREGIVTSPPFPNVTLEHGDPLTGEEFPVLLSEAR